MGAPLVVPRRDCSGQYVLLRDKWGGPQQRGGAADPPTRVISRRTDGKLATLTGVGRKPRITHLAGGRLFPAVRRNVAGRSHPRIGVGSVAAGEGEPIAATLDELRAAAPYAPHVVGREASNAPDWPNLPRAAQHLQHEGGNRIRVRSWWLGVSRRRGLPYALCTRTLDANSHAFAPPHALDPSAATSGRSPGC